MSRSNIKGEKYYGEEYFNRRENLKIRKIDKKLKKHLTKFLGKKIKHIETITLSNNIISQDPYYKQLKKNLDPELYEIKIDKSHFFEGEQEEKLSDIEKEKIQKETEQNSDDKLPKKKIKFVLKYNNLISYFNFVSQIKDNKTLVLTINSFVDYSLISKLELSIGKDVKEICFVKAINEEYNLKEELNNKVLIGKQVDKLYLIFKNENQFSFARNKTYENEIDVYLILNKDKEEKILYGLNYKKELTDEQKKNLMKKPFVIRTNDLIKLIEKIEFLNKKQEIDKKRIEEQKNRHLKESIPIQNIQYEISPEEKKEIINQQNEIIELETEINKYENDKKNLDENNKQYNIIYEKNISKINNLEREIKNNSINKIKEDIQKLKEHIIEIEKIINEDKIVSQEFIEENEELITTIDLDYDLEDKKNDNNNNNNSIKIEHENNYLEEENNEIIDIDDNIENEINQYLKEEEKLNLLYNSLLCKNCLKKPAVYLLFPCQHLIWCEKCYNVKLDIAGRTANNQIYDPKKSAEIKSIKRENYFTCDLCNKKISQGIPIITSKNKK